MKKLKKVLIPVLLIVVCVVVEILLSNHTAIMLKLSGAQQVRLNLADAVLSDWWEQSDSDSDTEVDTDSDKSETAESDSDETDSDKTETSDNASTEKTYQYKDGELYMYDAVATFENVNTEMKNIYIQTKDGLNRFEDIMVTFTDENFAYSKGFSLNAQKFQLYTGEVSDQYFDVNSYGKVKDLKIIVEETIDTIFISEIALNVPPPFSFSKIRFIFMLALVFIIYTGAWKIKLNKSNYSAFIKLTALLCIFVCFITFLMAQSPDRVLVEEYPSPHTYYTGDEYRQMFYSTQEGRVDIQVYYISFQFDEVDNIYDRSERTEKGIQGDIWDRVYYNGKFYSYFGIAPIFTVYYPVYFLTLTHYIPTLSLASAILCLYAIIFISMLYALILKRFCKGVPLVLALLGQCAIVFGTSIFAMAVEKDFYYIAVLSGIGWVAAFLYFILKAFFETNFKKRIIFLILTGISVPLIVASRPTLVLYCVVGIIPAVYILSSNREKLKHKIAYLCSVGIPIVIGAAAIMAYNYARFQNPFEFGFNYQLTVTMAQANRFSLSMILPMLYHYYFEQPKIKSTFPYFQLLRDKEGLGSYTRYVYQDFTMGSFTYPLTWFAFALPLTRDKSKKAKFKQWFFGTFLVLIVILSFIDMCKAGAHYRYLADILMPLMIVGTVTAFGILIRLEKTAKQLYVPMYIFITLALCATVVIGYLMIFANERGYFLNENGKILNSLRNL